MGTNCLRQRPARARHNGAGRCGAGGHHKSRAVPQKQACSSPAPAPRPIAPRGRPATPESTPEPTQTPGVCAALQPHPPPDSTSTFSSEPQHPCPSLPWALPLGNQAAPEPPSVRGATSPAGPRKEPTTLHPAAAPGPPSSPARPGPSTPPPGPHSTQASPETAAHHSCREGRGSEGLDSPGFQPSKRIPRAQ